MRSTLFRFVASAALAAFGAVMALQNVVVGWSGSVPTGPPAAVVQVATTRQPAARVDAAEVVYVDRGLFHRAQMQKGRAPNSLVLDLAGLVSLDAALTLVDSRRDERAAMDVLLCWVSAANRAEAAAAAQALSREGCTKVYASP